MAAYVFGRDDHGLQLSDMQEHPAYQQLWQSVQALDPMAADPGAILLPAEMQIDFMQQVQSFMTGAEAGHQV